MLSLSLACGPYDRAYPLYDGTVQLDGVKLNPIVLQQPTEIFGGMLRGKFDIAEMSLTHCFTLRAQGKAKFVTLPVFPSRMFRHAFIFANTRTGVAMPKDLEGKRIGVQGYQMTAAVWIRGLLRRDFGVDLEDVSWFEGGVNERGVIGGDQTSMRPGGKQLKIQNIGNERTLSDMLAADELDAIIGAVRPDSLRTHDHVRRMFPNYHEMERDYYQRTKVFPIMHGLVMREELHRENPDLARKIYQAFDEAKKIALAQTRFTGSLRFMLPWMIEDLEEIEEVFGDDFWPYGIEFKPAVARGFQPGPGRRRLSRPSDEPGRGLRSGRPIGGKPPHAAAAPSQERGRLPPICGRRRPSR